MNLKLCVKGLISISLFLTGCNSDSTKTDQLSDPVLVEFPVVYIERDLFINNIDEDPQRVSFSITDPAAFNPGANLLIKNNAFAESQATSLTSELFTTEQTSEDNLKIDIRDLSVSEDGQQFLVSIRAPEIENDDEQQPSWNIWHYSHITKVFQRLISDDTSAEQGDDLMAEFLPDGRIIFASNRQRLSKAILLDEGKSQYQGQNERQDTDTFNIHVMQSDGSSISQLTYNLSHDFYPLVMQNGKILYSRWDAMGGVNKINLYQMLPDGTENQLVFGWHSHELTINDENFDIEFLKPQQMPNGDIVLMLQPSDETDYQRQPVVINISEFSDTNQPIDLGGNTNNKAITELFLDQNFNYNFTDEQNEAGRLHHIHALPDSSKRYLLSIDFCRVNVNEQILACSQLTDEQKLDDTITTAESAYELWIYNQIDNTQQLVAKPSDSSKTLTEAIVLQPSDINDEFIADKVIGNQLDTELFNEQAAALHIRSVYDFGGVDTTDNTLDVLKDPLQTTAAERPARFIRIIRGVPMPSDDLRQVLNTDFGRSNQQLMREIIGYSPIQPDGSVKVKVPANVPLALSILDENGQRIGRRHSQWITIKAGETLTCNGCHTRDSTVPHGRLDAEPASINLGAVSDGVSYPNTTNAIIPNVGQTMAEADENTNGLAELSSDLIYRDIWSDNEISSVNPTIDYLYSLLQTPEPTGSECFLSWLAYCRIQINYEEHIAPLWALDRQQFDEVTNELVQDNTCTSCHQPVDVDGIAQIPAGQLDLSSTPSLEQALHMVSYRELFFNDQEQEVVDNILINRLVEVTDNDGNIVFEVDNEGELILDDDGAPIPQLTTVNVPSIMSTAGARSSSDFFDVFLREDHINMLSPSELKLLSEWLDIGGQYYNTPFYQLP